jgi:hypothetical protein
MADWGMLRCWDRKDHEKDNMHLNLDEKLFDHHQLQGAGI